MRENQGKRFRKEYRELAEQARTLVINTLPVEDSDEFSIMFGYQGFFIQIVFSNVYPLILFNLARPLNHVPGINDSRIIGVMNMNDILGSHSISQESRLYLYRTVHHLDNGLTKERLLEILEYSSGEASQAYNQLERLGARK